MHKLCLLLVASSTFSGESIGSITGGDQAVVVAHNAGTVPRVGGASSDSSKLLRSHDRALDKTASTTADLNLKSNGSTMPSSEPDLEDRYAFAPLVEGLGPGVSRAAAHLRNDQNVLVVRRMSREELNPVQTSLRIELNPRDIISERDLSFWTKYADRHLRKFRGRPKFNVAYRVFKGDRSPDRVFKRLISLGDAGDEKLQKMVAYMYNKLAEEVSAKFGDKASTWMAKRWMKMGLHPNKVATTLGIGNKNLAFTGLYSAAQWVDYVKMLQKKNSELAIGQGRATALLISHLKYDDKISLLRKVWPDHPGLASRVDRRTSFNAE
ncbi:unnamed protein product [Hyaloperonospora brassicae]|uniref:RxLR effector candidate protein n=1 Tax=Hyaloperonospora brassicae TaxID=162125 RepID=A0AAV0T9F0_HYABA|nr:unnamed protein product [Hyaloperonospora brassicae]